jgi:hypothetical protein
MMYVFLRQFIATERGFPCAASGAGRAQAAARAGSASKAWALLGPSGGDDAGARIAADPITTPVALSYHPGPPDGARRCGHL